MMDEVRKMTAALPEIWTCLVTNTWPDNFLRVSMGLSETAIESLPRYAMYFLIFYFSMAAIALVLHVWKKKKSFSGFRRKLTDLVLTLLTPLLVRMIVVIFRVGQELTADVEGSFSFTKAGIDWLGAMVSKWFYPIGLCLILLVIVTIPAAAVKRYLMEYRLAGIPWAIYDVGFGYLCIAAALLSMHSGNPDWYVCAAAAGVLIALGQTGGVDEV